MCPTELKATIRFMSRWAMAARDPYSTDTAAQIASQGATKAQASGNMPRQKRSRP